MGDNPKYLNCKHLQRIKPELEVTKEVADSIGSDYRTLPMFEKGVFDHTYRKHYSLQTNEFLACRWKEFKKTFEKRIRVPAQFPNVRDYHFYNADTVLVPAQTIYTKPEHKMKMGVGPGVDFRGQMPIPLELFMKRGVAEKKQPKRISKKLLNNKSF